MTLPLAMKVSTCFRFIASNKVRSSTIVIL